MAATPRSGKFIPDRAGIRALGKSGMIGREMDSIAGDIAGKTAKNAEMKGYAGSVKTKRATIDGGAGAYVFTDWPLAHLEEWGSVNNSPKSPMRRAIRSSGYRFREK